MENLAEVENKEKYKMKQKRPCSFWSTYPVKKKKYNEKIKTKVMDQESTL